MMEIAETFQWLFKTFLKAMSWNTKQIPRTWLQGIWDLKGKWAKPHVKWSSCAGMKSTQLSESLDSNLKNYLDLDMVQFFNFDQVDGDRRSK